MAEGAHGRREYLKYVGAISGATLAGCLDEGPDASGDGGSGDADDADGANDSDGDDDADSNDENGENGDGEANDDEENGDEGEEHEVVVGPDGDWRFDPEELTVQVGDTVVWYFDSSGHNVTSHPDAASETEIPEDAEPFTSYEGEAHTATSEEGTEFEHTFEVPGEYVYVCTPHLPQMTGTILVEE